MKWKHWNIQMISISYFEIITMGKADKDKIFLNILSNNHIFSTNQANKIFMILLHKYLSSASSNSNYMHRIVSCI